MHTYLLEKETIVKGTLPDVWHFFTDPHNLVKITPAYMNFKVLQCPDVAAIYDGMLIEYRVSPLGPVPMKWITLIKQVQPMQQFMDTQLSGPYVLWEHTHSFREVTGGVQMHDHVRYALPLGPLGRLAHALFVKRQLHRLFAHREEAIAKFFP